MAAGRIVFDGPPGELTEPILLAIYGETDGTVDEQVTSVSMASGTRRMLAPL